MRRIISLWFPDFSVERFIRARRKARAPAPPQSLPFALVEGGAKGLRLAAVNGAGRSFGLMRGQRLADARAAVPDLLTEPFDGQQDQASLLGLARWLERYSPWVAPDPPDGILLDVTGVPHLFGGEAAMGAEMKQRLAAYGFTVRLAFAATIGAAWALARYGNEGGEAKAQGLPVEALRIDGEAARTLRRLGLKTIGALMGLPRASLARRFRGEVIHDNVLLRLDEFLGHRHEPLNALNPPSSFMAHRAFLEPVISHEGLQAALQVLCRELGRDLEQQGKGALRLILKLFRSDGGRAQVPAGLSAPSHDGAHLMRLLAPKLDDLDAGFGIDAMTLEAREVGEAVVLQHGFMEDTHGKGLSELTDRVLNRQAETLVRLEAVESHVPERAERAAPLSEGLLVNRHPGGDRGPAVPKSPRGRERGKGQTLLPPAGESGASAPDEDSARPLMIFDRPEPAGVIAAVPDGLPVSLTWRRVTRRIVKAEGPERIAPEWWRLAPGERPRDYYTVEDEQGRRYWVFRDGLYGEEGGPPPKWFVHGLSA
ncbi:MAG: DNA polymerase Y family protein [Hyphomicrobiales bacterium]